jgi:hypothetical protein
MLMKAEFNCHCSSFEDLININEHYDTFCEAWTLIEQGKNHNLHQCPCCMQLWRIDARGYSNVCYALKLESDKAWHDYDASAIIKAQMLRSREGVSDRPCKRQECSDHAVNGSVYCLDHLYQSGARM